MFSLIITIVSIALVVALVGATMYYGGDTLTEGRTRSDAAAFVSGGQQLAGAIQMFRSLESDDPTALGDLVTNSYLSGIPVVKGTAFVLGTDSVTSTVESEDVCTAINEQAGLATPDAADVAAVDAVTYGCVSATRAFQFKF